jgi:hypothetical protein
LGQWIDATYIHSGAWLRTSAGRWVQVDTVKRWTAPQKVHNLTVADVHTYYVLAGNQAVLVHNAGPCEIFSASQLQKKFKHASDFGVKGSYSKANAEAYRVALEAFMRAPGTIVKPGTYRGVPSILHYNRDTMQVIVTTTTGKFVSGWKMTSAQLKNVMERGALGGG